MTPSRHRLVSLTCVALAVTVLAGCGAVPHTDRADGPVASRIVRPKQTATPSPTAPDASEASVPASPAEDAIGEQPTRSAATRATLPARLLTAEQLPGVTRSLGWTEGRTTRREPEALAGTCHRFAMLSIGAMRVAHRDFAAEDGGADARADQLVATFADAKTAWRAFEVLKSWHDDCGQALRRWERHDVGALEKVAIGPGEAHTYLLTYGPADGQRDSSYFDAEGLVLVGNRIAVLRIAYLGQDYDYADGAEPITAAVKAAAAKLH
jgi:hypothetical protein